MSVLQTVDFDTDTFASSAQEETGAPVPAGCGVIASRLLKDIPEYERFLQTRPVRGSGADLLIVTASQEHSPEKIFQRLRWGGVVMFVASNARQVAEVSQKYQKYGFLIERGPVFVRDGWCRLPIPLLSRKTHGFVARKVQLLPPGEITHRFTYHVQLAHHSDPNDPIVVHKQIPTLESVIERLHSKHPDHPKAGIERLAKKFVNSVFPTFLTREAGMLKILQEYLPAPYNKRVPRLISMVQDDRGFVRELKMNWLRNGGDPISHMEFCRQSADLLRVLHDVPRVIHLDLRLDNFVITPHGVGFVDFGSAVRENEDLSRNPLLQSLFGELLQTSQIQRLMEKMTQSGQVTSQIIRGGCHKLDKAADFFYLALQFNSPHANPDLASLIDYKPASADACKLSALTSQILRPADPLRPNFRSAKDILHGIERIQLGLDHTPAVAV